jgi:hypothetical protein
MAEPTYGLSSPIPNKFGDNDGKKPPYDARTGGLAQWCMEKVRQARLDRDERYGERWKEYGRIWRGIWDSKDKTVDSERSKLISPATMQAIDMTVSEMEEATFNKKAWFDIDDDLADQDKKDATAARDLLLEEFTANDIEVMVSQTYLLGAIYGTGIGKINVVEKSEPSMKGGKAVDVKRVTVTLEPVRPDQFVIDTAALSVSEALFCAHEMFRPRHIIQAKIDSGAYRNVNLSSHQSETYARTDGTTRYSAPSSSADGVLVTEYYGKVPKEMLTGYTGSESMPEAIVVIANEQHLLKAIASPFTMKDRPIIAYAHDTVPGEFWGRGLGEKGYNPQKALDSELRARIDALAIINAPMIGADITRLPRSPDMRVRPGKTIFTRGNPAEVFSPIEMGSASVLAATFQHGSDMERMVSMATGAMDTAAPLDTNRRNETASGMSMMGSGFIKRSKRAMRNVEKNFLQPLIQKSLWRYMQFDPGRFPTDYKFTPSATMGIMAKEVENSQLINMLGFLEPQSPEYNIVVKAIFDNSSSSNKQDLRMAMEQMLAPPDEQAQQKEQQMDQLKMQALMLDLQKAQKENQKLDAEIEKIKSETHHNLVMADLEDDKVDVQAANAAIGAQKVRMANRQNDIAEDRNEIERIKANKPKPSSS